jgi:hypothetical protein
MISTEGGISTRQSESHVQNPSSWRKWPSAEKLISLSDAHSQKPEWVMISTDDGISIRQSELHLHNPRISRK